MFENGVTKFTSSAHDVIAIISLQKMTFVLKSYIHLLYIYVNIDPTAGKSVAELLFSFLYSACQLHNYDNHIHIMYTQLLTKGTECLLQKLLYLQVASK